MDRRLFLSALLAAVLPKFTVEGPPPICCDIHSQQQFTFRSNEPLLSLQREYNRLLSSEVRIAL